VVEGVRRHDYLPFGEENVYNAAGGSRTAANGYLLNDGVRQQFTGHERDSETGLDFMQARYYASGQGRFTGVDPMNFGIAVINPQNWNRYIYALNNPLTVTDKNGKWPTPIHDMIVEMAFPGLNNPDLSAMKAGSYSVDFYGQIVPITLMERNANQHAMARAGQSAENAVKGANAFIAQNEAEALHIDQGQYVYNWTYYRFGRAAHTMMDNTSPAHAPFQEYGGLQTTYGILLGLDVGLFGVWLRESYRHAQAEANINSAQLNYAVSSLRSRFEALYGTERYQQAVPSLFRNAWFIVIDNRVRQITVPDLGTVTVRSDGSQEYEGPLEPKRQEK
jgi:RHS repeat-associated protein